MNGPLSLAAIPGDVVGLDMAPPGVTTIRREIDPNRLPDTSSSSSQGSRMSLASDDLEHVVVVPGRHSAPAASAGSATVISGDEGASDFAQDGEDGRALADAAGIFMHGDVEHIVDAVLYAPEASGRGGVSGGENPRINGAYLSPSGQLACPTACAPRASTCGWLHTRARDAQR
jgi:hypothetical protein